MSGVALNFNFRGIERLQNRIHALGELDRHDLLDAIGAEIETQTHRRIRDEKSGPDGTPWPNWFAEYAKTRHGNHSLLMGEGNLDDSIQSIVSGDDVETGSNLAYAAVHQFGSDDLVTVPAHQRLITQAFGRPLASPVWVNVDSYTFEQNIVERPYLGFSDENWGDIAVVVDDFLDNFIQGVTQ